MKQGFLAFVLASVFLFAIVAASARFSSVQPDSSYQKYQMAHLQELAVKRAFFDSTKKAAADAYDEAIALDAKKELKMLKNKYVELKVYENALDFRDKLRDNGYDVVFWCGHPDSAMRQQASEDMATGGAAEAPGIALPMEACLPSFKADVDGRTMQFISLGFSAYSSASGMGYAAVFPPARRVGF